MVSAIYAGPGKRSKSDTLNLTDSDGLKQGHWIFYGSDKHLPDYKPDQKVEEGRYINNRKVGVWTKYFTSGRVQNEITYKNSRPFGYVKIYYANGNLREEGIWKESKWQGKYKFCFENGSPEYQWDGDIYKVYAQGTYGKLVEHYRVLRSDNGAVQAKVRLNNDGSLRIRLPSIIFPVTCLMH